MQLDVVQRLALAQVVVVAGGQEAGFVPSHYSFCIEKQSCQKVLSNFD